jgi:hypothetical protein
MGKDLLYRPRRSRQRLEGNGHPKEGSCSKVDVRYWSCDAERVHQHIPPLDFICAVIVDSRSTASGERLKARSRKEQKQVKYDIFQAKNDAFQQLTQHPSTQVRIHQLKVSSSFDLLFDGLGSKV